MRRYKKIVAWQRGHDLAIAIYGITRSFPDDERFALTSQIRRAAYSVPSNIVEGSARSTPRDYLKFLNIAYSSLKEAEYFLLLARDLAYITANSFEELTKQIDGTFAPLYGLINSIESRTSFHRPPSIVNSPGPGETSC